MARTRTQAPKRRYRRRKARNAPLSHKQVKAVAKIARRVDLRNDEHKTYQELFTFAPVNGILGNVGGYSYGNILSPIIQGTAVHQRVGERIHVNNIYVKGVAKHTGLNNPTLHFMLIRTRIPNPELSHTTTGIFKRSSVGESDFPYFMSVINKETVQVLGRRSITFDRSSSSGSVQVKPFAFNCKIGKTLKYHTGTGTMMLDSAWQYMYFMYVDEPGNTGNATGVTLDVGFITNFSDA